MDQSFHLLNKLQSLQQGTGIQQQYNLIDTFFTYIRQNTDLFNNVESVNKIQLLAQKHVEVAQKNKATNNKTSSNTTTTQQSSNIHSDNVTNSNLNNNTTQQSKSNQSNNSENNTNNTDTNNFKQTSSTTTKQPIQLEKTSNGMYKPNSGRGLTLDTYSWIQTLDNVEVMIDNLPSTITRKQISITLDRHHIYVKVMNDIILDGDVYDDIDDSDSTWTIESDKSGNKTVTLYLPKQHKTEWWASLLQDSEQIDVQSIVPETSSLSDLDSDMRSTVDKMMFEQRMKQQQQPGSGSMSSNNQSKEDAIKKFMQAHPEMDFSKAKIQY